MIQTFIGSRVLTSKGCAYIFRKSVFVLSIIFFVCWSLKTPVSIVFLPSISALVVLSVGRFFSRASVIAYVLLMMGLSFSCSLGLFFFRMKTAPILWDSVVIEWDNWLGPNYGFCSLGWVFDSLAINMLLLVSSVSFLVHLYSVSYMWGDPSLVRFSAYLSLFTFFMFVVASSTTFIQFFFGWEGVGLMSYLLVGFWAGRQQAVKAAWKAVFVNRVGDFMLLVGLAIMYCLFRTFDFFSIFAAIHTNVTRNTDGLIAIMTSEESAIWREKDALNGLSTVLSFYWLVEIALFSLFLGAVAKSAQIILHVWLPDAMEGPTPVSALIHAATMVTAGVYLLIRLAPLFCLSFAAPYYMGFFGSLTCVYAGFVACNQVDIKKIIAYSTMSQLGYMVVACACANFSCSFFHLWVHGYVKALLFPSAGLLIHSLCDEQNLSRFGGLSFLQPLLFLSILVGSVSLMAVPLFAGYYSKDPIIELSVFSSPFGVGSFVYKFGLVGAFLTGFYSSNLFLSSFGARPSAFRSTWRALFVSHLLPYKGLWCSIVLVVLAIASMGVGYLLHDTFSVYYSSYVSASSTMTSSLLSELYKFCFIYCFVDVTSVPRLSILLTLSASSVNFPSLAVHSLPWPVLVTLSGCMLGAISHFHVGRLQSGVSFKLLPFIAARKVFVDKVINSVICRFCLFRFHDIFLAAFDKGLLEFFGPSGATRFSLWLGRVTLHLHGRSLIFHVGLLMWAFALSVLIIFLVL